MKKVVTIVGARPQFIKAAVVSRAIKKYNAINDHKQIQEIIIHSGQHYDANMSDIFFEEMQIPHPHYYLGVGGGSHGSMTGQMLEKIEAVLLKEKPDIALVYGDTNSTLAGALAAVKLYIPIAHVEAGLRSFNMNMPEEINRILTDRVSKWLFCPTSTAMDNLKNEGFISGKGTSFSNLYNVGDVMYDAAMFYRRLARPSFKVEELVHHYSTGFYLATIHRAENTDHAARLSNIIKALNDIAKEVPVILPIHPRTHKKLEGQDLDLANIVVIDPVGYYDMITLLDNCHGVFTDSGGVQKEAYFFRKPCITLRDETEWVELVEHGFNILVGADYEKIVAAEQNIGRMQKDYSIALYGKGDAGEIIVNILAGDFS